MGVMRFSTAEKGQGIPINPGDLASAHNITATAQLMLRMGALAVPLGEGMSLDITPLYIETTTSYYLQTRKQRAVDRATVFVVPRDADEPMAFFDEHGNPPRILTGVERIELPSDTPAFPLTTINPGSTSDKDRLLIHELIIPLPGKDAARNIDALRSGKQLVPTRLLK